MEHTGINFDNKVTDGKLENSFLFRNFYNGGGVAIGDLNNDGLADVVLTSNMDENKIYLNKGNFKFGDVTNKSGLRQDSMWSTGVTFADINNDGWLDIYICNSGHMTNGNRKNKLYINNHNMNFTEESAKYGLDISAYSTQVSFFDYDGDGDLDCFMINNSPVPVNTLNNDNRRDLPDSQWKVAEFLKGGGNHLFRNDKGHFTEVTRQAGIHNSLISFGLGVSVADLNGDGWPDVYISNDSYERDYLYINQKDGTFKDETDEYIQHMSMSSMGADIGDINNDGYPEIFTTDMLPEDPFRLKTMGSYDNFGLFENKVKSGFSYQYPKNCLQLNNGNNQFIDIANITGLSATDWSWGALMFDANNDGYNDIFVCNGINRDVTNLDFMDFFANDVIQKMILTGKKESVDEVVKKISQTPLKNKMYQNLGSLSFKDVSDTWGFTQTSYSNGAAYGDLNNDGTLDLIINNENGPAFVYKNNSGKINHNHFISVFLKGKGENTFAVGSKIRVYVGNEILEREVIPSRGFQSSVDYKQIIGLGKTKKIDSMIIIWPDRKYSKYANPPIDTVLVLQEPSTTKYFFDTTSISNADVMFSSEKSNFEKHIEDDNIDFYYEKNIPEMLSREGPKAAVADVNGDGLQDIFIGGTKNRPGQIYLQTKNEGFINKKEPGFNQFKDFEDDAVLFFDADNDGDEDLYVGPGGNSDKPFSRQMQSRLYKNNGKGDFTIDASAFPSGGMNIGVAIAYDFNHDGFLDLFAGGRNYPREYGVSPSSYLYVNDGKGHFKDIAKTKNPDIANIGMVTGAVWADITGDSSKELIITGEWMAPRIFSYKKDHFAEIKSNLNQLYGLWQTVSSMDVNNDGKMDLILGNIGENFCMNPDSTHPVKLWIDDFNQNGSLDKILTCTVNGKDMPVFLKHAFEDELPSIKRKNLKHAEYATQSIQELLPAELLRKATVKKFNFSPSIVAINQGDGNFSVKKLPFMVQLSSVNAIQPIDLDYNESPDLILGGNLYTFLPQFERLDASFGDVLLNDGKGNFEWIAQKKSGFNVKGMVRDIVKIQNEKNIEILFLINDEYPKLYQLNNQRYTGVKP